jgi:hypothetical protein
MPSITENTSSVALWIAEHSSGNWTGKVIGWFTPVMVVSAFFHRSFIRAFLDVYRSIDAITLE